jgi:hypothetical protein
MICSWVIVFSGLIILFDILHLFAVNGKMWLLLLAALIIITVLSKIQRRIPMNPGQQMFFDFVMERVQPGKEADIQAIMTESFKRQGEGTFTKEYMAETAPKMIALLRPECAEEFKQAAAHMSGQLQS